MKRTNIHAAILGSADGVTSIAGVIAGGIGTGIASHKLALAAIGGALAATISMGGAEMLSEDATDWSVVTAMAAGTLFGSALPALPLLMLAGIHAWIAIAVICLIVVAAVGAVRARTTHRSFRKASLQTLLVLAMGWCVGFAASRF